MTAFDALFVPEELRAAVGPEAWLRAMLDAERALAQASARAGLVPAHVAAEIAAACDPAAFDVDRIVRDGRAAGNPAEPLVRALAARLGDEAARHVHRGATSQDVVDTAAMLVAAAARRLVVSDLERAAAACAALAREHRDTPMVARTLLQHALPTTFGLKAAGWLVALLDARRALLRVELAAQLGGAAGTLAAFGDRGLEVAELYARELGLAPADLPWHTNRVRLAELGAALGIAAGVAGKVALDVVLLAQTEVGEVAEGSPGGSSTMPHKRNPSGSALVRACARLASAHASVLGGALVQEHERAAGAWQAEWEALSGALAYAGGALAGLAGVLERLDVDPARMRANLELVDGLLSERLALRLADEVGRDEARARVAEAVEAGTVREQLGSDADPATYLGSAGALVDRALARHAEEVAP